MDLYKMLLWMGGKKEKGVKPLEKCIFLAKFVTRKATNWAYEHIIILCDIELECHSEIDSFTTKCTQPPCHS